MDFKKIMPIMIVMIMMCAFLAIPAVSAATSRIAICDSNSNEVTSFHSTQHDEVLEIYARLYIDGEWKAWRDLDFDVYDPQGNKIIHCERITSMINGYTGIGIWSNELPTWKPGDYTLKVSYGGNEANGWSAASKTAVIHHTK